jgi:DNA end-binding protein Ku
MAAVWSGHLTFGLVSLPVQLLTAARRKTVDLDILHETDHSRIRQVLYCQAEDKPLEKTELVKGFQHQKGRYVVIDAKELEEIKPKSAKVMEILEFVNAAEVDPIYLDASYYMLPTEGGEKPYTLLYIAMQNTNFYALAKLTMHQREHTVLIRCGTRGLVLHTMFYDDELRHEQSFRSEPRLVAQKELTLAKTLIETLSSPFEPRKYHDNYRAQLERIIQAKIKGKKVVITPASTAAPVIDIMEALQKSLARKSQPRLAAAPATKKTSVKAAAKKKKAG